MQGRNQSRKLRLVDVLQFVDEQDHHGAGLFRSDPDLFHRAASRDQPPEASPAHDSKPATAALPPHHSSNTEAAAASVTR